MNKLKSLIIIQLKESIGRSQSGMNIKNRRLSQLLQIFVVAMIALPAITFSLTTARAFTQLGQPELLITSMYINSVMLIFFLAIPLLVSIFFYARDLRFLATLPVKEETIILSKLSTIYLYLLVVSSLFMGPAVVIYSQTVGWNLLRLINGLIALVLAPLLPLLISAVLVLLFSSLIRKRRNKNLLTILGSILLIFVILAVQLVITRSAENPEFISKLYLNPDNFLGFIGMRFPPSIWLTKMVSGSILDGLYFIGLNLLFIFILQLLARVYYRNALLVFDQERAASKTGHIYFAKKSQGLQLLKRNILIITKQPTFLLNTLLSMVVPLIMFVVLAFSGQNIIGMLESPQVRPYLILIFGGVVMSPAIVSNISATAITREGKAFWETRVLPVTAQKNMKYRILTTVLINLGGSVLLFILSIIILPITSVMYLPVIFLAVTMTLFLAVADFIINIYKPQLNWTHPTAAVKNNLSVTVSLGLRAVIGLIIYGLYKLSPSIFSDLKLVIISAGICSLAAYLYLRYLLYYKFIKQFNKISI